MIKFDAVTETEGAELQVSGLLLDDACSKIKPLLDEELTDEQVIAALREWLQAAVIELIEDANWYLIELNHRIADEVFYDALKGDQP